MSVRQTGQTTTGPTPARPGDWPPTADRASGPILGRFEAGGGGPASRSFPDELGVTDSPRLKNSFAGPQRRPRGFRGQIIPAEGRGAFLRRPGRFTGRIRGRSNHSRTRLDSGDAEPQDAGPVPRRLPGAGRRPAARRAEAPAPAPAHPEGGL